MKPQIPLLLGRNTSVSFYPVVGQSVPGEMVLVSLYDASGNTFPTIGTLSNGGVAKGNAYAISVAGTLGGKAVSIGNIIIALIDSPGQTASNWTILGTPIALTTTIVDIPIPLWNMDTDDTKQCPHGLDSKIDSFRVLAVTIFSNSGDRFPLYNWNNITEDIQGGVSSKFWTDAFGGIILNRKIGGIFDDTTFNAATGVITLMYTP